MESRIGLRDAKRESACGENLTEKKKNNTKMKMKKRKPIGKM